MIDSEQDTQRPYVPRPQPLAIPTTDWNEAPLLCLSVNDQWAAHVYGVLEALAQRDTWLGTEAEVDNALNQVDSIISALMEACVPPVNPFIVGEVRLFAFSPAPDGWLSCFGQAISRATYADLFAAIGTAYGIGDGTTTFNVPYTRRRFLAGFEPVNGGEFDLGHTGGEESHVLTIAEMPAHTHESHVHTGADAAGTVDVGATRDNRTGLQSGSTGGGGSHENRPPWVVFAPHIYSGVV